MNEESIFLEALRKETPQARAAFLDEACAGNADLRRSVEMLLRAHEKAGDFLQGNVDKGQTTDQPAPEGPGTVIGPYKLVQEIGEGGMGTVFMAQQTEPVKRLVALKVIKAGMDSRQVIARFEAERQALALMDHPHIAKVLDAGTTASARPYFVMELVKGVPITRYCDEHRLTPRQRLELFIPVCQAVQHAHQKGIIHRDLKPSNVLVALYDGKPVPKVIDFGVAKAAGQQLTEHTLVTGFGAVVGTLEYMSPEQAELNQLDIDTRSDIYSLGVLLYELLTGTTPLDRKRLKEAALLEVLRLIREEEPPKPSTRLSEARDTLPSVSAQRQMEPAKLTKLLRGELDWIVMKALEKDRNRRYETANGLAMDVQRYLADEPVQACPPSVGYRLRKFARRNRGPLFLAALAVAVLVLAVVGLTVGLVAVERERKRTSEQQTRTQAALEAEAKRRRQAREALDAMSSQVIEDWLAKQKELLPEHKAFLEKALAFYEEFARDTAEDVESRSGVADAFARVGRILDRLGRDREAERAWQQSQELYRVLATDFPTNQPAYSVLLANSYKNLGQLLWRMGRPKEAEAVLRDALRIQQPLAAEFPGFRSWLADSHNSLAVLLWDMGRTQEAEAARRDALTLHKQLAEEMPTEPKSRSDLAMSYINLGGLLQVTGRPKEAEVAYRDALALYKKLASDFPAEPDHRFHLAGTHNNLGMLLTDADRYKDAEAAYRDALSLQNQLAAEFPARPDYRWWLARHHFGLANLMRKTGRPKEMETAFRDALALRKQLAADFPTRPAYRSELSESYIALGMLLADTGLPQEAEAAFRDAVRLLKQLVTDFPAVPDYESNLACALSDLGELAKRQRSYAEACRWLEEALPHHQAALKANPRKPPYREFLRNHHDTMADARLGLGQHAAAAAAAEEMARIDYDPPNDSYTAASYLARCVPLAENDTKLPAPKRRDVAHGYAERAMHFLQQAVEKGYRNTKHMKQDKDLDPLRQREDFKKLLAELEKGKKE
jgi:serine/threonine protein kinase